MSKIKNLLYKHMLDYKPNLYLILFCISIIIYITLGKFFLYLLSLEYPVFNASDPGMTAEELAADELATKELAAEISDAIEDREDTIIQIENIISELETRKAELENQLQQLSDELSDAQAWLSDTEQHLQDLHEQIEDLD